MICRTVNIEKKNIDIATEVEEAIEKIRKDIIFYRRRAKYGSIELKFVDKDIATKMQPRY